jgi:hypothetical protein
MARYSVDVKIVIPGHGSGNVPKMVTADSERDARRLAEDLVRAEKPQATSVVAVRATKHN